MSDSVELYAYFRSSCSWRVRIALNLKGIDYKIHPVHLLNDGGEQLKDDYAAHNPMREVPCLCIDGMELTQSLPIIEYLDETRPEPPLLPRDDAKKRFQIRRLAEIVNAGIQPVQNLRVLKKHGIEHKMEWGAWAINHGFRALEAELVKTAGRYAVGDEISLADCYIVPQVYNAVRFNVDMSLYPTIQRVHDAASELEAFKKAIPEVQPDCPEELRLKA